MRAPAAVGDTSLAAWGASRFGQLGNGSRTMSSAPVWQERLTGARAIAAGLYTGYAVNADGTVSAWG